MHDMLLERVQAIQLIRAETTKLCQRRYGERPSCVIASSGRDFLIPALIAPYFAVNYLTFILMEGINIGTSC